MSQAYSIAWEKFIKTTWQEFSVALTAKLKYETKGNKENFGMIKQVHPNS